MDLDDHCIYFFKTIFSEDYSFDKVPVYVDLSLTYQFQNTKSTKCFSLLFDKMKNRYKFPFYDGMKVHIRGKFQFSNAHKQVLILHRCDVGELVPKNRFELYSETKWYIIIYLSNVLKKIWFLVMNHFHFFSQLIILCNLICLHQLR